MKLVGMAGFEPATDGSTVHCSARLSYIPCGSIASLIAIKGLLRRQYLILSNVERAVIHFVQMEVLLH